MILDLIESLRQGAELRDVLPGILFTIIVVVFSLSFHEMSHAFMSYKLGDPTARNLGRISLNPAKHLDPIGTISMMLFGFGWAKPVPANPRHFKNPRTGMAITAVAGPISNLLLSFVAVLVYILIYRFIPIPEMDIYDLSFGYKLLFFFTELMYYFHILNLYLAVFNLLPIPPLDGSKILYLLLPSKIYYIVQQYEHIIYYVLIALLFTGFLSTPLSLACEFISNGMVNLILLIPGI